MSDSLVSIPTCESVDVSISVGQRTIVARILSPSTNNLATDPLLFLHFATSKETALYEEPYGFATRKFLDAGHRVVSFDLPGHGTRVNAFGEGIRGICNAFMAGEDPFVAFTEDGRALIDYCMAAGLVNQGRIVICGTSRAAYLSMRLMAADSRIAALAAIAPVTDLRTLSEFAAVAERPEVSELNINKCADSLTGRPIHIVIGNHDARVSTASCCRLYLALIAAAERQGLDDSLIDFQVLDVPGHHSPDDWHIRGAEFLLKVMNSLTP